MLFQNNTEMRSWNWAAGQQAWGWTTSTVQQQPPRPEQTFVDILGTVTYCYTLGPRAIETWNWIGNCIYWTLTSSNYNSPCRYRSSYTGHFTTARTKSTWSHVTHQSSGTGFQRRKFPFFCVPELSPCHSHSKSWLTVNWTGAPSW
jgi:hypothetical protein